MDEGAIENAGPLQSSLNKDVQIEELARRVAELEEALRPFAEMNCIGVRKAPDGPGFHVLISGDFQPTLEHFDDAVGALSGKDAV